MSDESDQQDSKGPGGTSSSKRDETGASDSGGITAGIPKPGEVGESGGSDATEGEEEPGPTGLGVGSDDETSGGPPALPKRPDDVKGGQETPDRKLDFKSGEVIGGRFEVERYLGSSGGATSYLCRDQRDDAPVSLKVLEMPIPDEERLEVLREHIRTASRIQHPNVADILGMGQTEESKLFVAMRFIEGETLSASVAERHEADEGVELAELFHLMSHIADGLEAIHETTVHTVLTPFNVYLGDDGVVKIGNLGFGRIVAQYRHGEGNGPYHDSIYVPPEVTKSPRDVAGSADIYSLGMMTAELLAESGLPRDRKEANEVARRVAAEHGGGFTKLVANCVALEPSERMRDVAEFRLALEHATEEAGVEPKRGLPEEGFDIEPAVEGSVGPDDDELFDLAAPDEAAPGDEQEERYLVRKDGLDYGPFTKDEVLEQLYDDEIDEYTSIKDRASNHQAELGEMEAFEEEVEEYIPIREERRREVERRRTEIRRKVKTGGKWALVAGILAGLAALGVMAYIWLNRPEPEPLPMDKAVASVDYEFLPPPKDFETVAADDDMLNSIFNPETSADEVAEKVGGGGGGGGGSSSGGGGDDEANVVDMTGGGDTPEERLTDDEINQVIVSNFSALKRCVQKELERNSSFRGVTVKFYIRPNGSTGGVSLKESQYADRTVGRCVIQEFQKMEFPPHRGVGNRGVTYPLRAR